MSDATPEEQQYPECDKWREALPNVRLVEQFLDYARSTGAILTRRNEYERVIYTDVQAIVYGFFGIDEKKLETERRAVLDSLLKEPRE